jgi:hypothetical protein
MAKVKLRALKTVVTGKNHYVYPGKGENSLFEAEEKEAKRLIIKGAAEYYNNISAKAELQVEDADTVELVDKLKIEELELGLEFLKIEFPETAKKNELKKLFLKACQANPIQASMFFDELKS